MDELPTQADLKYYAPFILTLTTAACARESDSIISTVAIAAEKLIYKGRVKTYAESLWRRQQEPDDDEDKSQDERDGSPATD